MQFWNGKEDWKAWRLIYPREGLIGSFAFLGILTIVVHLVVLLGSDRYITALLG